MHVGYANAPISEHTYRRCAIKFRHQVPSPCSSFVREFVAEPYDGVTALLDLLKMIQLSQTDYAGQSQPLRYGYTHDTSLSRYGVK